MALWHLYIPAYELHSVRREFYSDDGRSIITTTVMVLAEQAQEFAQQMMWHRSSFPLEILSGPSEFRCRSAEVTQDKATYTPIAHVDTPDIAEAAVSLHYTFVNLQYEAVSFEYKNAWLYDDITVWYTCEAESDVEYLILDYTKFVWDDHITNKTPLRTDEAPAKRFVFPRYHVIIEHVFDREITNVQGEIAYITKALEKANGLVNAFPFIMWDTHNSIFAAEQVLLTVNSIKKIMAYGEWVYTLDLTFSIRNAKRKNGQESTWNMFWRPGQANNQAEDDWYKILHKKTVGGSYPEAKVYIPSSWVNMFSWSI